MRVLLVEDNPTHADLISEILTDYADPAFQVERAPRLTRALEFLTRETVDAVLLDLHLPDSDGLDTLRVVHETAPAMPIIVLTGLGDEEIGLKAVQLGAQDFLVKTELTSQLLIRAVRYGIERKRSEEAFKALADELVQVQKLEAVGRLAAGIAHEFNNVLMGVSGCAKVALRQLEGDHPAYRYVEHAHRAALRGKSITDQFMALSRKEEVVESVDVDGILGRMGPVLRGLLGEQIALTIDAGSEGARIRSIPRDLQQLLRHIAMNAAQAMPEGGKLVVRTRLVTVTQEEARRRIALRARPYLMLQVQDTGEGMDEETRARAFEPFFTRREVGQGTGLGLTMTYAIATRHGGHVELDSSPGQGTTVTVYFPVEQDAFVEQAAEAEPAASLGTVLVVEDEPLVRLSVRHFLEQGGYRVLEAASGTEALDVCRDGTVVDVVLTDIVLPGMGGEDVAERISALHPEVKVLFMSAYPPAELAREGRLRPSITPLEKPFTEDILLAKMAEVMKAPVAARA